jgi:hypothetical protein
MNMLGKPQRTIASIFRRVWRNAVIGGLLATALNGAGVAIAQQAPAASQEVIRLKTRGNVEQAYLLLHDKQPVKAVALLITGGYGLLKLSEGPDGIAWSKEGTSFLVINKDLFRDAETAAAVIDVPTDQWGFGYTPKFRKSDEHAADMRTVVQDLRKRYPEAKVFLIGTSQGATSAAYAGKALGKEVDGVALTASVFEWAPPSWRYLHDSNLSNFDFGQIPSPVLIVHHVDDRCVATPYSSAARLADRFPLITVKGGTPVQDNGCGPMGPHGFLGREQAVVNEIKNWMHGRPYLNTIQ